MGGQRSGPPGSDPGGLSRGAGWWLLISRGALLGALPGTSLLVLAIPVALLIVAPELAGVVVAMSVAAGWTWWRGRRPPGERVTARTQPELHGVVVEVAARVGVPAPQRVWLVAEPLAASLIRPSGRLRRSRHELLLGLPLVLGLDRAALAAVVAHECGHVRVLGDGLTERLLALRAVVAGRLARTRRPRAGRFQGRFLAETRELAFRCELAADAIAAEVAGVDPMARALADSDLVEVGFLRFVDSVVAPVLSTGRCPVGLYAGWQQWWAAPRNREETRWWEPLVEVDQDDRFATHPGLSERLAALGAVPVGTPVGTAVSAAAGVVPPTLPGLSDRDGSPVQLRDLPQVQRRLLGRLVGLGRLRGPEPVSWSAIPPSTYDEADRAVTTELFAAAARVRRRRRAGLSDVLDLLAAGRHAELAGYLEPALRDQPAHVRAISVPHVLAPGLTAATASWLRGQGWQRGGVLEPGMLVGPTGAVDVAQRARTAVTDPDRLAELRALVSAGPPADVSVRRHPGGLRR